jgi:hypothetical protein
MKYSAFNTEVLMTYSDNKTIENWIFTELKISWLWIFDQKKRNQLFVENWWRLEIKWIQNVLKKNKYMY